MEGQTKWRWKTETRKERLRGIKRQKDRWKESEVKWGRDRDGERQKTEVDKTKSKISKKNRWKEKRQKRGKDSDTDRQTEVKNETDELKKRRFAICPRLHLLLLFLPSCTSSFPPSLPPSLHFVVCLMLFQHLGASASHPPSDARMCLCCCCSVITHQGRKKSTQNKLKQRCLVWLNVPQTAQSQTPIYSYCNDHFKAVLFFSVLLFDSSWKWITPVFSELRFLWINMNIPLTCRAIICFGVVENQIVTLKIFYKEESRISCWNKGRGDFTVACQVFWWIQPPINYWLAEQKLHNLWPNSAANVTKMKWKHLIVCCDDMSSVEHGGINPLLMKSSELWKRKFA